MRILITGVAGFLGRALAVHASRRGDTVAGIDRAPLDQETTRHVRTFVRQALTASVLDELVDLVQPDLCVHCAGRASVPDSVRDPAGDFEAATLPTVLMLDALRRKAPTCRFILASSAAVYGDPRVLPVSELHLVSPVSPYGYHKLMCEQACREFAHIFGLRTAFVRIFSAYGDALRRQVVWDIFEKSMAGEVVTLQGVSEASRDFIHVRDVAAGILHVAAHATMDGEGYNLAGGVETPIGELAQQICGIVGRGNRVVFDGVVPAGTPVRWHADLSKLAAIGFDPTVRLEEGLQEVVGGWKRLRG